MIIDLEVGFLPLRMMHRNYCLPKMSIINQIFEETDVFLYRDRYYGVSKAEVEYVVKLCTQYPASKLMAI